MSVLELTQKIIPTLQCPKDKAKIELCDSIVKGLLIEVRSSSSGIHSYRLRYKDDSASTRYFTLGTTADISLSMARKLAADKKAEIRAGANPSMERKGLKQIPTLRRFYTDQYAAYCSVRKRSWHTDELRFNQRLLPEFGDIRLDRITTKQLVDFHSELREVHKLAPATCDHFIKLMRHVFNMAIKWEVIDKNPVSKKVALFNAYNRIERIPDETELQRLLLVLSTHPNRAACRISLYLLSTGCRLNEALSAEWGQIDWTQKVWRIPALNSKSKRMRPVPLNQSAIEVLEQVRNDSPKWIFFNAESGTHYKTLHNAWFDIRKKAGMPWLRVHDLRHYYASALINNGVGISSVQALLGHSSPLVTQRYLHMNTQTLLDASEVASQRIRAASPRLLPAPLPVAP